jgi:hypothetical protein
LALVPFTVALIAGCSESPEQPTAATGTVSALVIDRSIGPVADVDVILNPGGRVVKTGRDGLAVFEVPAGDYFVDANLCCVGPGFIVYHIPVEVRAGETVRVELWACLVCV